MQKWFVFGRDADFDAGIRFFEQQRYGEAAVHFDLVLESTQDPVLKKLAIQYSVFVLREMADDSLRHGEPLEAISLLTRACKSAPHYADIRIRLALAHARLGDPEAASQHLNEALQINPHLGVAERLRDSLENPDALAEVGESILEPDTDEAIREAKSLANQEDWMGAIHRLEPLVQQFPRYADLRHTLATSYLGEDRLAEALEQLHHATVINPRYTDALALTGVILRRQGDETGAREAFRAALEIDPNHPMASLEITRVR